LSTAEETANRGLQFWLQPGFHFILAGPFSPRRAAAQLMIHAGFVVRAPGGVTYLSSQNVTGRGIDRHGGVRPLC
jgi:hypothetical protein